METSALDQNLFEKFQDKLEEKIRGLTVSVLNLKDANTAIATKIVSIEAERHRNSSSKSPGSAKYHMNTSAQYGTSPDRTSKQKRSLSPGLKPYVNRTSPFEHRDRYYDLSPVRTGPSKIHNTSTSTKANEDTLLRQSRSFSRIAHSEEKKAESSYYEKKIEKLKKELRGEKKHNEKERALINEKCRKLENSARKLIASSSKIADMLNKKTDGEVFAWKVYLNDSKILEDNLNRLLTHQDCLSKTKNKPLRSFSQEGNHYRSKTSLERHFNQLIGRIKTQDNGIFMTEEDGDDRSSKKRLVTIFILFSQHL